MPRPPAAGTSARAGESERFAARARSVLACPADVHLVVDGVADVLADVDTLGMQDLGGEPTFSCPAGTALARAGSERRSALLSVESGLGVVGSPDRAARLTLAGRLEPRGSVECPCCPEEREALALVVGAVLLDEGGRSSRVPAELFASPAHSLNRGFLQRSVEHANADHQQELRHAVATTSGTRPVDVAGVSLADLRPDGVDVRWVGPTGGHTHELRFPRAARDPEELGALLRQTLHAGLC